MKYILMILVLGLFMSMSSYTVSNEKQKIVAISDSTLKSGKWSDATIWSSGVVPSGALKNVVISNNTHVIIDNNYAVNSCLIRQNGNVIFERNKFLNNICLNYEPDSIVENATKTVLYSSIIYNCVNTYPPPYYSLKVVCTFAGWGDSTVVTNKNARNGYWSNPNTFNTNTVPNGGTKNVYIKEYGVVKIDTSVIVNRLVGRRAYIRWTKGAMINGVSHQNYNVY